MLKYLSPFRCVLCHAPLWRHYDLCADCERDLPWCGTQACGQCGAYITTGERCGQCLKQPPHFTHTVAALWYRDGAVPLITQCKYHYRLAHARVMGQLLVKRLQAYYQNHPLPDAIVPLPLHWRRQRQRGFNQSVLLAKIVAQQLKLPLRLLLKRCRHTQPQVGLKGVARERNVKGAFSVKHSVLPQHILLVDDVMTTGASVHAAAQCLLDHGAAQVDVAVFARKSSD